MRANNHACLFLWNPFMTSIRVCCTKNALQNPALCSPDGVYPVSTESATIQIPYILYFIFFYYWFILSGYTCLTILVCFLFSMCSVTSPDIHSFWPSYPRPKVHNPFTFQSCWHIFEVRWSIQLWIKMECLPQVSYSWAQG